MQPSDAETNEFKREISQKLYEKIKLGGILNQAEVIKHLLLVMMNLSLMYYIHGEIYV